MNQELYDLIVDLETLFILVVTMVIVFAHCCFWNGLFSISPVLS